MTKKQRNRKETKQNKRNKSINRHYSSTAKNLIKLFNKKFNSNSLILSKEKELFFSKDDGSTLIKAIYSAVDKATKKGVMHINSASKKKSYFTKRLNAFFS